MSKFNFTPVIPLGKIILVTGVNGYIGAQVAENLLSIGYRVRGTVRNIEKNKALQDKFNDKYGAGKLQLVKVEKIHEEGAFEEAVKGTLTQQHL
jgi:nucleoside-diphosphate-sugar epimerase